MKRLSSHAVVRTAQRGFSLLELLIVLAILGVLAAMVVPNLLGTQQKANIKTTQSSIHGLEQALKLYAADHAGEYPQGSGDEVYTLLMAKADETGKAVKPLLETKPLDAWGMALFYEYPNTKSDTDKPAIWSAGPNKQDEQGGGDDVVNWTVQT